MSTARAHVGVLVPWANTVVEAELHRVAGGTVTWHYARLVPASHTTGLDAQFLEGLLKAVPAALMQLSALPLRRVYLACTSAAFIHPEVTELAQQRASITLLSAFDAIAVALSRLAATRIVLLTPYPDDVTDAEVQAFHHRGVTVTGHANLGLEDRYDTVTPEQVKKLISAVDRAAIGTAEAIVLSCTGWPTFGLIRGLRSQLGKPVLSSNLAIGLHAREAKEA